MATRTLGYAGTSNYIYLTLVGDKEENECTLLHKPGLDLCQGAVISDAQQRPTCCIHQEDCSEVCQPCTTGLTPFLVRLDN